MIALLNWTPSERSMARQFRRIRSVPLIDADPTVRAIAAEIDRDFGAFVPPFALHAAAPSVLAACWTMFRESLVARHVDRRTKEVVASAVSRLNRCPYCVDVHTSMLHALGDRGLADALHTSRADETLGPVAAWAAASRSPGSPCLREPPFPPAAAPEMIGIALGFHYVNRMVTIFLAPSPLPFRSARLKALGRRLVAPLLTGIVTRRLEPGLALRWLPEAPLPLDLAWSECEPTIAAAFARAATAFEGGGAAALLPPVRALVQSRLAVWRGEDVGLGRGWLEAAIAELAAEQRPAARLALLTALAPHQVDDDIVADFRAAHPGDDALVAATAWASFTAARRVGTWLAVS